MTAPAPGPGIGRGALAAALGLALDQSLCGRPDALPLLHHPWDAWWVAVRSLGRARPSAGDSGTCGDGVRSAARMTAAPVPEHPGHGECACGCYQVWAAAMRTPGAADRLPEVPQRLTLALLKPGAPREEIRSRLRTELDELHSAELVLTAEDCDRLYPDAYGAEFVARRTAYMTSGPVEAIVLAGGEDAVTVGSALKRAIRADLGAGALHNHLHMPDNPGEALADIAVLAGWDVLDQLYRRWEIHDGERRVAARLAGYRAHLDRGAADAGLVGPRRPPGQDEPAPRRH